MVSILVIRILVKYILWIMIEIRSLSENIPHVFYIPVSAAVPNLTVIFCKYNDKQEFTV